MNKTRFGEPPFPPFLRVSKVFLWVHGHAGTSAEHQRSESKLTEDPLAGTYAAQAWAATKNPSRNGTNLIVSSAEKTQMGREYVKEGGRQFA